MQSDFNARVAELVDALDSKSSSFGVRVRFPPRVQDNKKKAEMYSQLFLCLKLWCLMRDGGRAKQYVQLFCFCKRTNYNYRTFGKINNCLIFAL